MFKPRKLLSRLKRVSNSGATPTALLLLRTRARERQFHVDYVRLFVDVRLGFGLAQIVEQILRADVVQEGVGIVRLEWSAGLQRPDFANRGLAGEIQADDLQFAHGVLRTGIDIGSEVDFMSLIVDGT